MKKTDLRQTIKTECKRRAWSAYKLGQESGVPIRTCQSYLAGHCDITGEKIGRLLDALGLSVSPETPRKGKRRG